MMRTGGNKDDDDDLEKKHLVFTESVIFSLRIKGVWGKRGGGWDCQKLRSLMFKMALKITIKIWWWPEEMWRHNEHDPGKSILC